MVDFSNSYADPEATLVDVNAKFVPKPRPAHSTGPGPVRVQSSISAKATSHDMITRGRIAWRS